MARFPDHSVESLYDLLEKQPQFGLLAKTMVDWTGGDDEECLSSLVCDDYTLSYAKDVAGSVAQFLEMVELLARKRGLFFRFSSPLRYMMNYALEYIHVLQRIHVYPLDRFNMETTRVTMYRKNSVVQDERERREQRLCLRERNFKVKRQRLQKRKLRRKISSLKNKIKKAEQRERKRASILRISMKYAVCKRRWCSTQRWQLTCRMHNVTKKQFMKMKEVIEFYIPPITRLRYHEISSPPVEQWTTQMCRHVSHVIR